MPFPMDLILKIVWFVGWFVIGGIVCALLFAFPPLVEHWLDIISAYWGI